MTQEDKDLLLKDLCARLPYKIKVCLYKKETCILMGIDGDKVYLDVDSDSFYIENIKPYLRSTSSMTEEELNEFRAFHCLYDWHPEFYAQMCNLPNIINMINWLNAHHFDYHGLIPKGLAIEVTKENNPYKIVER